MRWPRFARPALADERLPCNAAGQVMLKLKTPWRDGTPHVVLSPLEFVQRLAALVPRPRLHLTRFHGVLAPNPKLRPQVVPQPPPAALPKGSSEGPPTGDPVLHLHRPRIGRANLLQCVFQTDLAGCAHCGGPSRIVAAILDANARAGCLSLIAGLVAETDIQASNAQFPGQHRLRQPITRRSARRSSV